MSALVLLAGQVLLFFAALAGVLVSLVGALRCAGRAANGARPVAMRVRAGALAGACVLGIVASAGLGFWGTGALLYLSSR